MCVVQKTGGRGGGALGRCNTRSTARNSRKHGVQNEKNETDEQGEREQAADTIRAPRARHFLDQQHARTDGHWSRIEGRSLHYTHTHTNTALATLTTTT